MSQTVAYRRLKTMESHKTVSSKGGCGCYERWPFTRGSKYRALSPLTGAHER